MNYIQDFIYVNKQTIEKSVQGISKNWAIIFTGLFYSTMSILVNTLMGFIFAGPFGIIGGFISYFVQSAIISNYLYLLYNIINYNRFNLNDFKQGFMYFIWKIYGVLFIIYLAQILLSMLSNILGTGAYILNLLIGLIALVVLNALPETIYLKSYSPTETLMYAFEFMKENWFNWLLPNILFIGLLYFLTGNLLIDLFNTGISFSMNLSARTIFVYLAGQLIFSFMMIYRGNLYKLLSTSTRRKRMFMNKF